MIHSDSLLIDPKRNQRQMGDQPQKKETGFLCLCQQRGFREQPFAWE